MNKKELIALLKEKGLVETLKQGEEVLAIFQEGIRIALEEGNDVKLTGFMNFEIKSVEEREHSNPKTGEKIVKPEHKVVKARLSKLIKTLV